MKDLFSNFLFLIICFILISGCAGTRVTGENYTGRWHYTFPTMEGTEMEAVMTLEKSGEGYSGNLSSSMGSVDLQDLKIEEGNLTAFIEIEGYRIDISGSFETDTFTGTSSFQGQEFPMNAVKEK